VPLGFRAPPPLGPSSLVAVVAPSSPFDREELFRGLAWLRTRYRLRISSAIFSRAGYLAGDDGRRVRELASAMRDPEVGAVMCARGGYGAQRILDALPWDDFSRAPKWLVGFSDATALHIAANARGVESVHGPNVTGLGRNVMPRERLALIEALEHRRSAKAGWAALTVLHGGASAVGPVVGGNLALVHAMAAAGQLVVPEGALLALEDVTERPYRVDRMLTSLRLGGHLGRAAAIVFGGFTQCDPGADGTTVDRVLSETTAGLGIPVVGGAPFGHGAVNHPFVLGALARLDGDTLTFTP
jgi:muramoyltetrapeptide carboxypeptidase